MVVMQMTDFTSTMYVMVSSDQQMRYSTLLWREIDCDQHKIAQDAVYIPNYLYF